MFNIKLKAEGNKSEKNLLKCMNNLKKKTSYNSVWNTMNSFSSFLDMELCNKKNNLKNQGFM